MSEQTPESERWLAELVERSAILPEESLRRHWRRVLAWLPTSARYELAAILLEVEHLAPCE